MADPLYELFINEHGFAVFYSQSASNAHTRDERALYSKLSLTEKPFLKRVAALYYLRYGRLPDVSAGIIRCGTNAKKNLRECYMREAVIAKRYKDLFKSAEESIAELLFDAIQNKERNAAMLKETLENLIIKI